MAKAPDINVGAAPAEATVVAALVADAAKARGQLVIHRIGERGTPFVVLDTNGHQQILSVADKEGMRKKGTASFIEQASFVEYVKLYADDDSRVFCNVEAATFLAVLDYHKTADPVDVGRRGEHRATLQLRFTEDFERWKKLIEGGAIQQAALAEFLEDHYSDIQEPDGAEILELVRQLEVKNDVAFKSSQRRSDGGYDLNYSETVQARAGQQGTIEVPNRLLLALQVFQGGRVMELPVRVRFKLAEGRVFFGLTFLGLEKLLTEEILRVRTAISEGIGRPVWAGSVSIG